MTSLLNQLRHDLEQLKADVQMRRRARRNWLERLMDKDTATRTPRKTLAASKIRGIGVSEDDDWPCVTLTGRDQDKAH